MSDAAHCIMIQTRYYFYQLGMAMYFKYFIYKIANY